MAGISCAQCIFCLVGCLQRWPVVILHGMFTSSTSHIRSTPTLACLHVAVVIQSPSKVTIARRTAIVAVRKAIGLRHALIAVFSDHQTLARAFASVHVAARIVDSTKSITGAIFTSQRIVFVQIPKAILARIATSSLDIGLTVTRPSFNIVLGITYRITNTIVNGSMRITVAS